MTSISVSFWGIYSVWWRHFQAYRKTWLLNFIPPISEPVFYLAGFSYGLSPLIGDMTYLGEPIAYPNFITSGIMAIGLLNQAFFEGAFSSFNRLNFQKTWHALLAAPLSFTDVFLGELLWSATRGLIAGISTGIVAIVLGIYDWTHLILSLPILLLGSLLFGGFGLWIAGCMEKIDHINVPFFLFIIPMTLLSGSYFPRDVLPETLLFVVNALPLSVLIDLLRWPLGLPSGWLFSLLWLIVLTGLIIRLAAWQIYPRLFQ